MSTLERIAKIVGEYKDLSDFNLTAETSFADLELDSLDVVDMVMACEEEFGATIELDDNIKTVGDIMAIVDKA